MQIVHGKATGSNCTTARYTNKVPRCQTDVDPVSILGGDVAHSIQHWADVTKEHFS